MRPFFIGCLLLLLFGRESNGAPSVTQIEFCQFSVSEGYRFGNATFSVLYHFRTVKGSPVGVVEVSNPVGIRLPDVSACLATWKLPLLKDGTSASAEFRWTHGVGWDLLRVKASSFLQEITLSGDRCQSKICK